ncbi:AAA family ATPase [Acaryochloris sp. CCMEE 5410]|uniref:AAA family ATPase n=1 Tax=Acaryochloris sp. CCMEE 5410 TaxID=310037 RepID=UPI0021D356F8|nr:AAA family ATPase [Acaryochloris sp. CCMEE 5410]
MTAHQVWLIDEAGMKADTDEDDSGESEPIGAKVIFVGDAGQNSSIEAGIPSSLCRPMEPPLTGLRRCQAKS